MLIAAADAAAAVVACHAAVGALVVEAPRLGSIAAAAVATRVDVVLVWALSRIVGPLAVCKWAGFMCGIVVLILCSKPKVERPLDGVSASPVQPRVEGSRARLVAH